MEYEKNLTIDDDSSKAIIVFSLKKEVVKEEYDSLILKYSKELSLPGFRRGKVPVSVLQAKYSSIIKAELMQKIVDEVLKETLESLPESEAPIVSSTPELVGEPKFDLGSDFSFTVRYDVMPKVEILKDEGFSIKAPQVVVLDEDIDAELKKLQLRNATIQEKDEGAVAEKEDIVTVDYRIDGEEASVFNDYVFTLGSYDSVYKFDDDVLGMKKGEEKEVLKKYGADFEIEALREKEVKLVIKVKAIKGKKLPAIDDELAQDISEEYKTLEDLKSGVREKLELKASSINRREKERALISELIKANPINLPESMIAYQFVSRLDNMARQYGMKLEQLLKLYGKSQKELFEQSKPNVIEELSEAFLLNKLVEKYDINLDDEELKDFFEKRKEEFDLDDDSLKSDLEKPEIKSQMLNIAKKGRVLETLISKSTFEKGDELKLKDFIQDNDE